MSVRFQARLVADTISEYLSAATRGAPVAQTKHSRDTTLIGDALDASMGAAALALYDIDAARLTLGAAYIARGGLAALGAFFTGLHISFGNGSSSGDPEKNRFNRQHRAATAAINVAIGTALLTGIAGREAAMAGTAKGVAEAAFGPLVERFTRPTKTDVTDLIDMVVQPASPRHLRVAESDLRLLGVEALPAICKAYASGKNDARLLELIRDITYWPNAGEREAIAAVLSQHATPLFFGSTEDVERGVRLLDAIGEKACATVPPDRIASLAKAERQLADAATGTKVGSDERRTRDLASTAIARLQGARYTSLDSHMNTWDTKPEVLAARVEAIRGFGEEAIEHLRTNIPRIESYSNVVSIGAEVAKRLETMPVAEALSIIPDSIDGDGGRGKALVAMRSSGSIDRQQLDNCVEQAPGQLAMRDAYRQLLAELEGGATRATSGQAAHP